MSSKKVVLIGGGGHAASLVNAFGAEKLCGYVAPEASDIPLTWLGDDDAFFAADNGSCGAYSFRCRTQRQYGSAPWPHQPVW